MRQGISRYAEVADLLKGEVHRGVWAPGTAIPSESDLAKTFSVALGTMRKALDVLVEQGIVERIQGKGTYVRGPLVGSSMLRFFRFEGKSPTSKVLSVVRIAADPAISKALNVEVSAPVLEIKRIRSLEAPYLSETIYLDAIRFIGLETVDWTDSELLYPIYQQFCGQVVNRAVDTVSFGWMNAEDANNLLQQEGAAAVIVRRVAYAMNGDVLEVRLTKGNALEFNYSVTIN